MKVATKRCPCHAGMAGPCRLMMIRPGRLIRYLPVLVLALFLVGRISDTALAAERQAPWTFRLYIENDGFDRGDEYYSNGIKLSWLSPDFVDHEPAAGPSWRGKVARWFPCMSRPGMTRNLAVFLGQNIYTPLDVDQAGLVVNDRPYAGWTYGGAAVHGRTGACLDILEIQLGVVGPLSMAEETQKFIHDFKSFFIPNGWNNQLHNEPGLVLTVERRWRAWQARRRAGRGFGADAITRLGATLGNIATYANTGLEVRLGWNLPDDFGVSRIRPAGDSGAPTGERTGGQTRAYLFGSGEGRVVWRDIFLDGNTFVSSHRIDKKPLVGDFALGIRLAHGRYGISFAHIYRTREFDGQPEDHTYGSLVFSFSY
ncbi:MAG: lipid A deacylase LpxR family protein [Desulfobacterales bacterium]|nr:lipid A deacylase LpxR family protein [Desulfobacterales bacterium]